ncbi:MAG: SDR family NAD(P)-dependent oxidoreductase [Candidatus Electryonea clarkiae]|nr:SDR family NAD(P)-dependent oxidoreductase [Candidatus Electryonea clarkiae]MDP8287620.1 SDR family NAD(P)-dependent oxidoreductase [Candidatus Electryonea clarkiae]
MSSGLLEGKKAFVTGGSQGIGTSIVQILADEGADVAFTYRRHKEEALTLAEEVKAKGRKGLALEADTSDFKRAQEVIDQAKEELGGLDILINNAGMNWDGVIWKMKEEQFDAVINVDLKGYFNYIRAVTPGFREQKSGRIINVTSINGLRGKFGQANYAAAKSGVHGMTKAVAKELGGRGITVNAVAPGLILTAMMDAMPEEAKQASLNETAVRRLGEPDDVAHVVAFFASDRARHVTGEIIKVDGGQYI